MDTVCSKPQLLLAIVLSFFFGVFSTIGFTSGFSSSKSLKCKKYLRYYIWSIKTINYSVNDLIINIFIDLYIKYLHTIT